MYTNQHCFWGNGEISGVEEGARGDGAPLALT